MPTMVVEDYLQIIHYLSRDLTREGAPVIAARLAERMHVTPPTAGATLQRMERDGLIRHGPHREILFTDDGRRMANDIVRRHALAERLLTDVLRIPWHEAHEEARLIEHAISPRLQTHLRAALGDPTTCPHGNPIPDFGGLDPDEFPLDQVQTGDMLVVLRITEEAEEDTQLLRYLQERGMHPGARMRVRETSTFNALIVLDGPAGDVTLGVQAAAKVRVRRA
jgi:DtxR family Mn-dependent transcriptional regulator